MQALLLGVPVICVLMLFLHRGQVSADKHSVLKYSQVCDPYWGSDWKETEILRSDLNPVEFNKPVKGWKHFLGASLEEIMAYPTGAVYTSAWDKFSWYLRLRPWPRNLEVNLFPALFSRQYFLLLLSLRLCKCPTRSRLALVKLPVSSSEGDIGRSIVVNQEMFQVLQTCPSSGYSQVLFQCRLDFPPCLSRKKR